MTFDKRGVNEWPFYDEEQIDAVSAVLRSGKVNYWTGAEVKAFEAEYAEYLGRSHAIALANGTVALELALLAFGVGEGDEVIVPARTYVASASCAAVRGARPVVADVDMDSGCVTAATIEACITPRSRAIVVVHLGGWPCDMDPIMALAEQHDLIVIEDCAQAHGAFYKGRPVGSIGHAGAFSFCQDKIITTGGEGGLLALDDARAWQRAWAYKDIGRSYDAVYHRAHPPGFRWLTESFGTNWRLTEMQAALGRIQLRRLPQWQQQRALNAARLSKKLAEFRSIRLPKPDGSLVHAFYRLYAYVEPAHLKAGWDRDRILAEFERRGVPSGVGSCSEIYRERAFTDANWAPGTPLANASLLGTSSLVFFVHPTLEESKVESWCALIGDVLADATSV